MAQDSAPDTTPSTPVGTADVANASALVESVSVIRQALGDGSTAVVAKLAAIASAITASIIGGTTGTTANRALVAKGTTGFALQPTVLTINPATGVVGGTAVWNGTAVAANYGGTGVANDAAGTLTWSNAGAISITFPSSGTLAILGANTFTGAQTLAAGTTSLAPAKFQSGTNLTTATAGACEYDGTCFYETSAASSRQVVDTEQIICLSADYTLSDVNTAQKAFNASSNGALTVQGLTTYLFEALYMITNMGTTSHTWATIFGGTATFTSANYIAAGRTATDPTSFGTAGTVSTTTPGTLLVVTQASTSATENVSIQVFGVLRINAGGTVIPQVKLSAATGGTEKMLANSYFRIWPVGSNSVTNVGNWS